MDNEHAKMMEFFGAKPASCNEMAEFIRQERSEPPVADGRQVFDSLVSRLARNEKLTADEQKSYRAFCDAMSPDEFAKYHEQFQMIQSGAWIGPRDWNNDLLMRASKLNVALHFERQMLDVPKPRPPLVVTGQETEALERFIADANAYLNAPMVFLLLGEGGRMLKGIVANEQVANDAVRNRWASSMARVRVHQQLHYETGSAGKAVRYFQGRFDSGRLAGVEEVPMQFESSGKIRIGKQSDGTVVVEAESMPAATAELAAFEAA